MNACTSVKVLGDKQNIPVEVNVIIETVKETRQTGKTAPKRAKRKSLAEVTIQ